MAGRDYLADIYTPAFLMALCDGLTGFQSQDVLRPFMGQWMRVRGVLENATPNPRLKTAGVTIAFPNNENRRRSAFLWFTGNLDELAKVGLGDVIWAEGRLQKVSSQTIVLEECGLIDRSLAATLEVTHQATELQKALEDTDKNWGSLAKELNHVPPQFEPDQDDASDPPAQNRGGRPSGKAGEPIARITMRLAQLPSDELAKQTAASLALDLIEEYRRLRLTPPVLGNAEREAAGILRALRG